MISKDKFKEICRNVRRQILISSFKAKACHIGSALSCVEILVDIYYNRLKQNDVFLFSKASGASALYSVLAEKGIISKNKVVYYLKKYPLANKAVKGVIHSVGSVGMGLSVAVGFALVNRKRKVYCLISDGQLDEGITYEAALFSAHHKLDNLFVICDNNGIQAMGKTKDILDLETAFDFYQKTFPHFENIKTIKGAGISFLENKIESHYLNLDKSKYEQALKELN